MKRTSVFESSETGRVEIDYSALSMKELGERIEAYENKYGMSYAKYNRQFSSDEALPWEFSDLLDWEYLTDEKKDRLPRPRSKKELASGKGSRP